MAVGVVIVLAVVAISLVPEIRGSWRNVSHPNGRWLAIALGAFGCTFVFSALNYRVLAKHKLKVHRIILVLLAGSFANRLLPIGSGAISVMYLFLRKQRHSVAEAGAVIAMNNGLGIIGHIVLLTGITALYKIPSKYSTVNFNVKVVIATSIVICIAIALIWFKRIRRQVFRVIRSIFKQLGTYRAHPLRLLSACMFALAVTVGYTICLIASARAVGAHMSPWAGFLVLTSGLFTATLIPLPGGLGATEAGLFTALVVLVGVSPPLALATVVVYRLITYWLPAIVGAITLDITAARGYI